MDQDEDRREQNREEDREQDREQSSEELVKKRSRVAPEMAPPDYTIFSDYKENEVVSVTPKPCELVNIPDVHGSERK
ncbi:hypothetical protein AgCh_023823 [Apium graveolens]